MALLQSIAAARNLPGMEKVSLPDFFSFTVRTQPGAIHFSSERKTYVSHRQYLGGQRFSAS